MEGKIAITTSSLADVNFLAPRGTKTARQEKLSKMEENISQLANWKSSHLIEWLFLAIPEFLCLDDSSGGLLLAALKHKRCEALRWEHLSDAKLLNPFKLDNSLVLILVGFHTRYTALKAPTMPQGI